MNPTISYSDYEILKTRLQVQIPYQKYDYIISFTNGGNVLSCDLAKYLRLSILFINPKSFDHTTFPSGIPLVVDDIYDTGKTWNLFQEQLYGIDLAVLFTTCQPISRYYAELIPSDHPWIHFPWEF